MIDKINNKKILFMAIGGKEWIGGLYYVKNIIYTLFKNNIIADSTKIYILVEKENMILFKPFLKNKNVSILIYNNNKLNNLIKKVTSKILKRNLDIELLFKCIEYKINYIYPIQMYPSLFLKDKSIFWIPDFQHVHLPEMFSKKEINGRNKLYGYMAKNHKYLILSSKDAFNDYRKLYPNYMNNVYILNFESDIENIIETLDDKFINNIIKKYNIPKKYIFLPNQFWKHKNHITAFKAIDNLVNKQNKDIYLVCTGNTNDYRNKDYYNILIKYIKEHKLEKNIIILGFISRSEQLALMKASVAVLQPSLFEGWGTVVEDAKKLDKTIILSDINVHYEQKNDKCIMFKRNDFVDLGEKLYSVYVS